jgi:hypothetical protein
MRKNAPYEVVGQIFTTLYKICEQMLGPHFGHHLGSILVFFSIMVGIFTVGIFTVGIFTAVMKNYGRKKTR